MSNFNTHPLYTPGNGSGASQPIIGSELNAFNALKFYFPRIAVNAVLDIAAVNAIKSKYGNKYNPDPDEQTDLTFAYGSYLYQPTYGALTLGNTDPHIPNGNQYTGVDGNTYTFDNIVLPIALIEMNQPTNIVKSRITGNPGTVKEYMSIDDWSINISSVIIYPTDQAPIDFMRALYKMKQAPVSIPVTNYWLNAFGVTHIVIEDVNPVQEEGKYSSLAFQIKACSDIPPADFLP